jgi:hypothetical protein
MTTHHISGIYELPQARLSHRAIALASLVLATLGVFVVPAILAILGGSYVLATSTDTLKTERTRNLAFASIIVAGVSLLVVAYGVLLH